MMVQRGHFEDSFSPKLETGHLEDHGQGFCHIDQTRATPDDAWILSLKVEGLTASLTGNAANAAALMRQLEQMPGAREVRATSAATRRIDGTRESFNIEVRLDPAVFGRLPPTEGAQK